MEQTRTYTELSKLHSFGARYHYLELKGFVGNATFGFDRWMNQVFYSSREWRRTRDGVILRDCACDLGVPGFDIRRDLLVHHMNPITPRDIESGAEWILDPEFLITTCLRTHNAIHFGDDRQLARPYIERKPGDTKLW